MSQTYDTPPALTLEGWKFDHKCGVCVNNPKYKYKHPDKPGFEVEWHIKKYQFKVLNRGMTVVGLKPIGQLEVVLKAL